MKIEAHKNANGDLLVTFSFPGEPIDDLCVGTDRRWMDEKDKDHYMEGWQDRITSQYEAHAGRPLTGDEMAALDEAISKAKVSDGIVPKD